MNLLASLGIQQNHNQAEKWIATLGGSLAIFCICALSFYVTDNQGAAAVVPSMGAATVLLFAVPHGPLSQPWALFVGNGVSAFVGVTCALFIPNILLAAALAVGLAIGAMHITRSIHPPGGATALAAVIGGEAVHNLGYWYVIAPTILNCGIIFIFAVIFNGIFPWRRYPLALIKYIPSPQQGPCALQLEYLSNALKAHNITTPAAQLMPAINDALRISKQNASHIRITLGGVYTNDQPGANWAVRKVIDEHAHPDPEKDIVIYSILDGAGKNASGSCRRYELANWAQKQLQAKQ